MLTREHAIADIDFRRGTIHPDRLVRGVHRNYLAHAERMLRVYSRGAGETRRTLLGNEEPTLSDLYPEETEADLIAEFRRQGGAGPATALQSQAA